MASKRFILKGNVKGIEIHDTEFSCLDQSGGHCPPENYATKKQDIKLFPQFIWLLTCTDSFRVPNNGERMSR